MPWHSGTLEYLLSFLSLAPPPGTCLLQHTVLFRTKTQPTRSKSNKPGTFAHCSSICDFLRIHQGIQRRRSDSEWCCPLKWLTHTTAALYGERARRVSNNNWKEKFMLCNTLGFGFLIRNEIENNKVKAQSL